VDQVSLEAFSDELEKIAGLGDLWQGFLDLFRSKDEKIQRRVDYHFSPNSSSDKWRKLVNNAADPKFVKALATHPDADDKLILHAKSMGDLTNAPPVGKVKSSTLPGKSYEIRKLPGGRLGCQCGDWRYKGSINLGYECKHIRAYKAGKDKAD